MEPSAAGRNSAPGPVRRSLAALRPAAQWMAGVTAALLHRALGTRNPGRLAIFVYHRVSDEVAGVPRASMNVAPAQFRRQLAGLLDRGVTFWPLRRVLESARRGDPLPPSTAVVTFDDGFANLATAAWPILRELEVPATAFLCTAYLDSPAPFPFDAWATRHMGSAPPDAWRPLSTDQCRRLLDDGLVELGSHTHTHGRSGGRGPAFADELRRSQEVLGGWGLQRVPFAFPGGRAHLGQVDGERLAQVRAAGMTCALTTACRTIDPRSEPFGWGRFNVYGWDTAATLAAKAAGYYGWAPALEEQLARLGPRGAGLPRRLAERSTPVPRVLAAGSAPEDR